MNKSMSSALLLPLAVLSGCGGGGGEDSTPAAPNPGGGLNSAPVALILAKANENLGWSVRFDGSSSYDDDGDPLTYRWQLLTKPNSSSVELRNGSSSTAMLTPDVAGSYRIALTVNDGDVDSQRSEHVLTVVDTEEPPTEPPIDPNNELSLLVDYFDIGISAQSGEQVIGKVQLRENFKTSFLGADFKDYSLNVSAIDSDALEFEEQRSRGRLEGIFKVATGKSLSGLSVVSATVDLVKGDELIAQENVEIHIVGQTEWESYLSPMVDFVTSNSRLWGRRDTLYGSVHDVEGEPSAEDVLTMIESNNGKFPDLYMYEFTDSNEYGNYTKSDNGSALEEASARIGGLGYALEHLDPNDANYQQNRDRIANAVFKAIIAYRDIMPVDEFDDFPYFEHNDITHQWRFLDPLCSPLVQLSKELWSRANQGEQLANDATEAIYDLYQIAFSLPSGYRVDGDNSEPLEERYFLAKDISRSPGVWSDANRGHRLRAWSVMPILWRDYNRPLTDKLWWYDEYQPSTSYFEPDQGLFDAWTPTGSFADLLVWVNTNQTQAYAYGQSGMLPDGTISHHTGTRQDIAMSAYGYEWMVEGPVAADLIKHTRWKPSMETIDNSFEFMLKSLSPMLYKGGHDIQAVGRSFMTDSVSIFSTDKAYPDITKHIVPVAEYLEVNTTQVSVYLEPIRNFTDNLSKGQHTHPGNHAFWNSEFMVHRVEDGGSNDWYASWKSQSIRVRGAESFASDPGMHNGSGVLQVKVNGDEYSDIRRDFDWHILPGITEEWRTDSIPKQSQDHDNGLSIELLAGINSNGTEGLASFDYSSKATYPSARADKSAFFSQSAVFAMGSDIQREVKNGGFASEENEYQNIVTTIDQTRWESDFHYFDGSLEQSINRDLSLNQTITFSKPIWMHQGRKGYIVWPSVNAINELTLIGGDQINDSYDSAESLDEPIAFVINHGLNPEPDKEAYQYLVLPNVELSEMATLYESYTQDIAKLERIQQPQVHGVVWKNYDGNNRDLIQLAFHKASTVTLASGKVISADKAALVMLKETSTGWQVSVSDPTHHGDGVDPITYSRFRAKLDTLEENEITVSIDWMLKPGVYQYQTDGYDNEYVQGQDVTVENSQGISYIKVALPDDSDDEAYDFKEELYAGMTAVVEVPNL